MFGMKNFEIYFYPHAFLKNLRDIAKASVVRPPARPSARPSIRLSVTLSLPKPLDVIQPNLVCELLT